MAANKGSLDSVVKDRDKGSVLGDRARWATEVTNNAGVTEAEGAEGDGSSGVSVIIAIVDSVRILNERLDIVAFKCKWNGKSSPCSVSFGLQLALGAPLGRTEL